MITLRECWNVQQCQATLLCKHWPGVGSKNSSRCNTAIAAAAVAVAAVAAPATKLIKGGSTCNESTNPKRWWFSQFKTNGTVPTDNLAADSESIAAIATAAPVAALMEFHLIVVARFNWSAITVVQPATMTA